ncbi:conjugal transfer protein [Fructobacillus sp. M158]|uniref:conjugal transfer protein n=1 Tax=Fructobacillus parabroussonetiae TaxID=2713174 RepID=UPI00200AA2B8|nr:conjugal transfer protein [Fructobacillus parabroussonetiae]MCK8617041.1 conjugal transfer protein [Fructobacillus parabroussonetiae]
MKRFWQKLKGPVEYERQSKDKGLKIPKKKTLTVEKLRKVVFAIVFLFIALMIFMTWQASQVVKKNQQLKTSQASLEKKLDKASAGSLSYNPLVGQYFEKFLNTYYNYNQDKSDEWRKSMKAFFPSGFSVTQLGTWSGQQSLKDHKILGIFNVDGVRTVQYAISLENNGKQSNLTVNIPYVQDNSKFTVVGLPYVASDMNTLGHVGESRLDKTNKSLDDMDVVDDVKSFTKTFLNKYVSSSKEDMALLMNDPRGLAGKVDLQGIDNIKVSGTKTKPVVTATVTVQVHDTDIKQNQQVRLELKKQQKTYFVDKFVEA